MVKKLMVAMFGLAIVLSLASPSRANAAVVVSFGVGPVYAPPAYGYVYVPRPYIYPRPYFYPRRYVVAPAYVYPSYGYYGRFDRDRRWDRRDFAYRERGERRRDWR